MRRQARDGTGDTPRQVRVFSQAGSGDATYRTKARLVVLLMAAASAAACGGGGMSSNVQTQPQLSVQVSPGSLTFGNVVLGVTSASRTVSLIANGSASVNVTAVSVTGDFSQTNNCPSTLTSSAICTVLVYFTPSQGGSRTGTLSITTSASSAAQTVSLTGTGVSLTAQISPGSLTFTNQIVGTTSAPQPVTFSNTGSAALTISSVGGSPNFGETNNCGSSVAVSGSCTINVTFTPTASGTTTGTLTVTDHASGSPQTVNLNGTGIAPVAGLSAQGLTFTEPISTTSAAQTVTITNSGTSNLTISTATIGGTNPSDFAKSTDTCTGATVAPTMTCAVSVTFTPATGGSFSAMLSFTDNAGGSPQAVTLSGTGTVPSVSLSAPTLAFTQLAATTSTAQALTLTNIGTANLNISTAALGGTNPTDFAKSADSCTGATLTPTQTCEVSVTFTPPTAGSFSASLIFTDSANGSPQTVTLSGSGTNAAVGFSASGLSFPSQTPQTTSSALNETVTNTGTGNLTVSTAAIGGTNPTAFAKSADTCTGATVTPGNTCQVSVTFTPSAAGNFSASLIFTDNGSGNPQSVTLSGTGTGSLVSFSPTGVSFSNQALSMTSTAQTETVTNSGNVNLVFTTVTIGGTNAGDFAISADTCANATITPTNTCTVGVTFTPSATGTRTASLSFADNVTGSPQVVNLTGNGIGPLAGVYTQRYDNARSGQNTTETFLTPSNVTVNQFGKLFSLPVDGQVYAQPLYVAGVTIPNQGFHNVVYVETQNDSVFAFDADGQSTTPLWQVSFLNSASGVTTVPCADVYGTAAGACDITPVIGITSTPVIDPSTGTLYVTAKTREPLGSNACSNNGSYNYCYRLHALDITTGAEKFGGPVLISGSVPGTGYDSVSGAVTFGAFRHLQRPGLLLLNGTLYLGFGSHGDYDPYHGWLMAYNPATLQQLAVWCTTPNGQRGAIWNAGGGISADTNTPSNLFVVTANGTFDYNTGGSDYGDSVLRMQLVASPSTQFQVLDYFTPADQATMQADDLDLGSSPALLLPTQSGTYPDLLAVAGKDGRIWLLNRDNLGKYQTNDVGAVELIPESSDSLFGGLTYWNGNIYVQERGSNLDQFALTNGTIPQTPTYSSEDEFGNFPNPLPVVSSNGTTNGVLWLIWNDTSTGLAVLYAFDPTNVSNTLLYDSLQAASNRDQEGTFVKFAVPTVANGKVYVGTATEVDVFGLLP